MGGQRDRSASALNAALPGAVAPWQAARTRPVARRDGGVLVGEEHAILYVAAALDGPQRRRTIQPTVNPRRAMTAYGSGCGRLVWRAVRTDQSVALHISRGVVENQSEC